MEEDSVAFSHFSMDVVQFILGSFSYGSKVFVCYNAKALLHLMLRLFNAPMHSSTHFVGIYSSEMYSNTCHTGGL